MTNTLATLQRLLDGPWRHAAASRAACRDNAWEAFQCEQMPTPGWHRPLLRRSYEQCLERAVSLVSGPVDVVLDIIPIWVADTHETEGSADDYWFRGHAVRVGPFGKGESGPMLDDADPAVDVRYRCEAVQWTVGNIVHSRSYAPSIELELRHAVYGVLPGDVLELNAVETVNGDPLPRPTIGVPPFCSWVEPRVTGLARAVVDELRALSITTDDEGNLVDRTRP